MINTQRSLFLSLSPLCQNENRKFSNFHKKEAIDFRLNRCNASHFETFTCAKMWCTACQKKIKEIEIFSLFSTNFNQLLIKLFSTFFAMLSATPKIVLTVSTPTNQQLFGDNDVFQQYGIPMNPTDNTAITPGLDDRQRQQNDGSANTTAAAAIDSGCAQNSVAGNELISYQQVQQPIDFTDFLNIDDNDLALNASGSFATNK